MPNLNKVLLMGHLTRDPEMRYLPSGSAVAKFTVAVSRKWKEKESGNAKEETAFVECTAFSRQAEVVGEYVKKGNPLFVEGRLKQDNWQDKQTGQKRSKLCVSVDSVQLVGSKSEGNAAPRAEAASPPPHPDLPLAEPDDVPF